MTGFPSDNGLFYGQYIGIVAIHVAFQLGFCTFVLSNYMKTIPRELNEAAVVDGAAFWKTYRSVVMPLTRPALAALATLQVTWVYNDFFWALVLMAGAQDACDLVAQRPARASSSRITTCCRPGCRARGPAHAHRLLRARRTSSTARLAGPTR